MKTTLDSTMAERARKIGTLHAEATGHAMGRRHDMAANAHFARGQMHEGAGEYAKAADAYRDAIDSMLSHAQDCGFGKGYAMKAKGGKR